MKLLLRTVAAALMFAGFWLPGGIAAGGSDRALSATARGRDTGMLDLQSAPADSN